MNNRSVSHIAVQNQQPSWIDDPFQLGTHAFRELKPMSHKQNLIDYAEELTAHHAKYVTDHYELTLDMVSRDEQHELARLYIESIDREIEWACYGADTSINSDFLCAMLAMLKDNTTFTKQRFAEVVLDNVLVYYKSILNQILCAACDSYLHKLYLNADYRLYQDRDHGDVMWRKCK